MTLPADYQSYMLRIYRRTEAGTADSSSICLVQLENIQTGERRIFDSLQAFHAYLEGGQEMRKARKSQVDSAENGSGGFIE